MAIEAICNKKVVTIERESTLKEASQLMQKQHVGSVIVVEAANGKTVPCGIITDRDVALALSSSQRPQDLRVEQIMHSHPVTARVDEGIFELIARMRKNGVKRVPVVDKEGSLCGVVSADDLLNLIGQELSYLTKITDAQIKRERGIKTPIHFQARH